MPYKVLVVDDSTFYRKRLVAYLDEDPFIQVVGEARDGKEAIKMTKALSPDVVTMDVEMPGMDGIAAVSEIMRSCPTAILMVSSLTQANAQVTLDALAAGALDYMPKNFDDICDKNPNTVLTLKRRVKALARKYKEDKQQGSPARKKLHTHTQKVVPIASRRAFKSPNAESQLVSKSGKVYRLLVIAASTGGPQALQKVLNGLPVNFPHPIVLVQHMPGSFTSTFAERLNQSSDLNVKLAEDGEKLSPGYAYLAPGGMQLRVTGRGGFCRFVVEPTPENKHFLFEPCINYTLESVATSFDGDVLATILTGMGDDGTEGAKHLKQLGATVWAQDESSSVVYGMPKSVFQAGCVDRVLHINNVAHDLLIEMTQ